MALTATPLTFPRWKPTAPEPTILAGEGHPGVDKMPRSYWLLLAFLVLLYANLPFLLPASEALRPAKIIAVLGIVAILSETVFGSRRFEFAFPEGGLLLGFVGAAGLSCLTALWPGFAFDAVSTLVRMALVYFVIVNCVTTVRALQGVMATMVLGGLFPALGTLKNYAAGNLVEGRTSWVGIFANPNEVAYSLVILVPLAIYLISVRGWLARVGLAAAIFLFIPAVYVTFSRGGLIGLGAVAVFYAWRKGNIWLQIATVVAVAGGLLLASHYWSRGEDFSQLNNDVSFQQRIATSQAGFAMFLDHPLLGVGLACSVVAWPLYAPQGLYTRGALVTHNTLIQALSETGILGFVPFVALIGVAIWHMYKLAKGSNKSVANPSMAIEVSLWGLIICGMSGGYVVTWFPYLLLGLAGSARRIARDAGSSV